jgi:hypothetical protein
MNGTLVESVAIAYGVSICALLPPIPENPGVAEPAEDDDDSFGFQVGGSCKTKCPGAAVCSP